MCMLVYSWVLCYNCSHFLSTGVPFSRTLSYEFLKILYIYMIRSQWITIHGHYLDPNSSKQTKSVKQL